MAINIRLTYPLAGVPEDHQAEATREANEAFVMSLLRQGDISAGRAAEILNIDRARLSELMYEHNLSPFGETPQDLEREIELMNRVLGPGDDR